MSTPLVSVLIPIYGVEKYIERCARSVFGQTYENLEIIFVDDCSPDRSADIVEKVLAEYPDRIPQTRIIRHEHNQGLAGARLTALNAATGKYIQNYDSDDWVETDMISEMVDLAEKESADITICDFMYVYSDHKQQRSVNPPLDPMACLEAVLLGKVHSSVANKLIRRDLYLDNGIHPIPGLNMLEDLSVMYKLLYFAKKLAYIPKPFYNYNKANENSYTSYYTQNNLNSSLLLIDEISKFTENIDLSSSNRALDRLLKYKRVSFFNAYLLLSKDMTRASEFGQRLEAFGLKYYIYNPIFPIYYRLCGIFYKLNLKFAISCIRKSYWHFKNGR